MHCCANAGKYVYEHSPFAYPEAQLHEYVFTGIDFSVFESLHVAPFLQGLLAHSFTSTSHVFPLNPGRQVQENALGVFASVLLDDSLQVAPFLHGFFEHSLTSVAQLVPENPDAQEHAYAPTKTPLLDDFFDVESVHVAPFLHGWLLHSSTSVSQTPPWYTRHLALPTAENPYVHQPELDKTCGRVRNDTLCGLRLFKRGLCACRGGVCVWGGGTSCCVFHKVVNLLFVQPGTDHSCSQTHIGTGMHAGGSF